MSPTSPLNLPLTGIKLLPPLRMPPPPLAASWGRRWGAGRKKVGSGLGSSPLLLPHHPNHHFMRSKHQLIGTLLSPVWMAIFLNSQSNPDLPSTPSPLLLRHQPLHSHSPTSAVVNNAPYLRSQSPASLCGCHTPSFQLPHSMSPLLPLIHSSPQSSNSPASALSPSFSLAPPSLQSLIPCPPTLWHCGYYAFLAELQP